MRMLAGALAVVVLYMLVWFEPAFQLGTTPAKRAEVFVANTVCQGRVPNITEYSRVREYTMPATLRLHTFADIPSLAEPFVPLFTRSWRSEALVVALAAIALVGTVAGRAWGGVLGLASITGYLAIFGVAPDAFQLLRSVGPELWWTAVQQWTWPMVRDLLLLPFVLGIIAAYATWLIARGVLRLRRAANTP
jgi:hypothetical protein